MNQKSNVYKLSAKTDLENVKTVRIDLVQHVELWQPRKKSTTVLAG